MIESQPSLQIYLQNPWYLTKTAFLFISWMVLGLHGELVGPTMIILAYNTHVTYNGIASALALRSTGFLVANICCTILQSVVQNYADLLLALAFLLAAIAVFVTPFVTSIVFLSILLFVQGLAVSLTGMGGTSLLFQMWNVNAAAPLSMVQLGYGIGAIIVNLLVYPFLGKGNLQVNKTDASSSSVSDSSKSNIRIPYIIIASVCLLIAIGHVVLFIHTLKTRRKQSKTQKMDYTAVSTEPSNTEISVKKKTFLAQYSPAVCGRGFFGYGFSLSLIFIIYTFFAAGAEQAFAKFYFSYLKLEQFRISTEGASQGIILYWLSYSMGRLLSVFMSTFIPVFICLSVVWTGGLLLSIVWIIFVWKIGLTSNSLFVLGSLTGLILAPISPLSLGWFNQKLNVVPSLVGLLLCGLALGSLAVQKVAGFLLDHEPNHFATLLIVCIVSPIILYIIANVIIYFHERKLKNNNVSLSHDDSSK